MVRVQLLSFLLLGDEGVGCLSSLEEEDDGILDVQSGVLLVGTAIEILDKRICQMNMSKVMSKNNDRFAWAKHMSNICPIVPDPLFTSICP